MREVRAEAHLRHRIEEEQRREEIVGDAVAMRLELDLDAFLLGHREPLADHGDHALDREWHHLADDVDEARVEILRHAEDRAERLDGLREGVDQAAEAMLLEE